MFMRDFDQAKKELAELGIKQDLNINSVGSNGWTCMHAACQSGNTNLAQFFLQTLK